MPNYRRLYHPGGTYFFTFNLADRSTDLLIRHIDDLRTSWRTAQTTYPFETVAVVILPEHIHSLWTLPPEDQDYARRISMLKAGFTRRLPDQLKSSGRKGERGIWQPRYWEHLIRDEKDLENHVNYIHHNPVKHGYVTNPDNWPYSSWHRYKRDYGAEWKATDLKATGEP
ncbi:MAG: transposase [Pseudomonadota bacterium]